MTGVNTRGNDYLIGYERGYNKGRQDRRDAMPDAEVISVTEHNLVVSSLEERLKQLTAQLRTSWVNEAQYKRLYENLLEDFHVVFSEKQIQRRRIIEEHELDGKTISTV